MDSRFRGNDSGESESNFAKALVQQWIFTVLYFVWLPVTSSNGTTLGRFLSLHATAAGCSLSHNRPRSCYEQ